MQTQLWNPWSIFDELERTVFAAAGSQEWPVFDIEDNDEETTLTADLPGMTGNDIELTITGSTLTVRGERKVKNGRYVSRRRFTGAFEKQFRIGEGYDLDDVQARVADGVLTITLAKAEKATPRRIKLVSGVVEKVKGLLAGDKENDPRPAA
jgi:HSP20 family protein